MKNKNNISIKNITDYLKKFDESKISLPFSEDYYMKLLNKLDPENYDKRGNFLPSQYEDGFLYNKGKFCREVKSPYISFVILKYIRDMYENDIKLCDVGCGLGTIVYLSKKIGYNSIGIEYLTKLRKVHKKLNIDVLYGDALMMDLSILKDIDVIYLYRPIYDDVLADKLLDRIYKYTKNDVIIVYLHPDDLIYDNDKFIKISISSIDGIFLLKK